MYYIQLPLPGSWLKLLHYACISWRIFPVQCNLTWQQMNDPSKSWHYSTLANSLVWWNTDIHIKKDGAVRLWVLARSVAWRENAPSLFFFIIQMQITHINQAHDRLQKIPLASVSVEFTGSQSRWSLCHAGMHICLCVNWNLAAVLM